MRKNIVLRKKSDFWEIISNWHLKEDQLMMMMSLKGQFNQTFLFFLWDWSKIRPRLSISFSFLLIFFIASLHLIRPLPASYSNPLLFLISSSSYPLLFFISSSSYPLLFLITSPCWSHLSHFSFVAGFLSSTLFLLLSLLFVAVTLQHWSVQRHF